MYNGLTVGLLKYLSFVQMIDSSVKYRSQPRIYPCRSTLLLLCYRSISIGNLYICVVQTYSVFPFWSSVTSRTPFLVKSQGVVVHLPGHRDPGTATEGDNKTT